MSKYLVTGGAGFIGGHIVDRLLYEGHDVVVLDNLSTGRKSNVNKQAKFILGDIRDMKMVEKAVKGCDGVFHTAALARIQPSIKDPLESHEVNVQGTLNVLWASYHAGVRKVVYSASSSAYGDNGYAQQKEENPLKPSSPYAVQKMQGEEYCELFWKLYELPTVCLRYFNVYGPRMIPNGDYAAVISIFIDQLCEGKKMTITGDGEQRRDFTYVSDVVDANIKAMDSGDIGVFNIGKGDNQSINEIAQLVADAAGVDFMKKHKYVPGRKGEARVTLANNSSAREVLGWKPKIDIKEGIKRVWETEKK